MARTKKTQSSIPLKSVPRKSSVIGKAKDSKLWTVLNSPFCLFTMTSVLLSGVSFSYQKYIEYKREHDQVSTKLQHLKTEIGFRLDSMKRMENPEFTYTALFTAHGALLGESGNKDMDGKLLGEYSAIYAEYSQRSLVSLIWELEEVQKKNGENASYRGSILATEALSDAWNKDVRRLSNVNSGESDSMWGFKALLSQEQFSSSLSRIRLDIWNTVSTPAAKSR